jgi:hypothetical protein
MIALSGVLSSCDMFARNSDFILLEASSSTFFCWSLCSTCELGHVARGCEHSLKTSVPIVKCRCVVGHHGQRTVSRAGS